MNNVFRSLGGKPLDARYARVRAAGAIATFVLAVTLAGCGGGGGGGSAPAATTPTTPSSPVTVTCPKPGETQTAATTDAANALCSALTVNVTPANGATGVAYAPFSGVSVTTNGTLDPKTIANGITVTVTGGSVVAGGTIAAGTTGASWNPISQLNAAGSYTATCSGLKDSIGRAVTCSTAFKMASISCTAPLSPNSAGTTCTCASPNATNTAGTCVAPPAATGYTWNSAIQTFVANIGVKVTNPKVVPIENGGQPLVNGSTWKAAVANGTIQYFDTGLVMTGYKTDALSVAFFVTPVGNNVCTNYVYKNTGDNVYAPGTYSGCHTDQADWVTGTSDGIIQHYPALNKCFKETWDVATQRFIDSEVACPF